MLSLQSLTALISTTSGFHGERRGSSPAGASGSQRRGLEEKAEGPGQKEGFVIKEGDVSLAQLLRKPPSTGGSGLLTSRRCRPVFTGA